MKTYRVKGYETVMYYVDIKAQNKHDAYTKAMDVNVLDWEQEQDKNRTDLNIKKKDIEEIKSNVIKIKTWTEGYNEWKKSKSK